jgi:hypothetical protein
MTRQRWTIWSAAAILWLGVVGAAQVPKDPTPPPRRTTRADLKAQLQQLRARIASPDLPEEMRRQARQSAERIESRLAEGDFQPGDPIWIEIAGEAPLTDTFTVSAPNVLTLPEIGDISLTGVLHSELEAHLRERVGAFVRDPVLHAQALIRIAVLGEVTTPGFYVAIPEATLAHLVMLAGGPTPEAAESKMRVERADERVLDGERLLDAVSQGNTLDQLHLQDGDRILIPRRGESFRLLDSVEAIAVLIPAVVLAATALF